MPRRRVPAVSAERAASLASRRGIDMPSAQGQGHPTPTEMRLARLSLRRFVVREARSAKRLLARRRDPWTAAVEEAERERAALGRCLG